LEVLVLVLVMNKMNTMKKIYPVMSKLRSIMMKTILVKVMSLGKMTVPERKDILAGLGHLDNQASDHPE